SLCVPRSPRSPLFPYTTLFRSVRQAALRAAPRLWHPGASDFVLDALREEDPGVLAAAADALAAIAGRVPDQTRVPPPLASEPVLDRKSTRLNSSHVKISYAVFC